MGMLLSKYVLLMPWNAVSGLTILEMPFLKYLISIIQQNFLNSEGAHFIIGLFAKAIFQFLYDVQICAIRNILKAVQFKFNQAVLLILRGLKTPYFI